MPASDSMKTIMENATTGERRLKPAKLANESSLAPEARLPLPSTESGTKGEG